MRRSRELLLGLGVCLVVGPAGAEPRPFRFGCVTVTDETDCRIGEDQVQLGVTDPVPGDGQLRMAISNVGPESSSVAAVYIDDGVITAIAVEPTPGVAFSAGSASPPDMPGGDLLDPPFVATTNLVADANPPPEESGVNPGETLVFTVTMAPGATLGDVATRIQDGTLRVGVHVIGYDSGGSESFILPWCAPPPPTVADFIFVIDTSITMRRDLRDWLPSHVGAFPDDLQAAGIDWRLALVRYGTNRNLAKRRSGPQIPDLVLPFSSDPQAFRDSLDQLTVNLRRCSEDPLDPFYLNCIRNKTEAGSEAVGYALDHLRWRHNAIRNLILYTDEDDDHPALYDNGELKPFRQREPPGRGPGCYGRSCEARWLPFQQRQDALAARLIADKIQLGLVVNSRDRPSIHQFGDPDCSVEGPDQRLDVAQTLQCLRTTRAGANPVGQCGPGGICASGGGRIGASCLTDADCETSSIQAALLGAGICDPDGFCSEGSLGAECADDHDCAVRARTYRIPPRKSVAEAFFPDFLQDQIREQVCPGL